MAPPPPPVVRSLYRSLLRAAAPFSPPFPSYAAYAALLHRTGHSHDWEECVHRVELRRRALRRRVEKDATTKREHNLPHTWARNLTRSYEELTEEYAFRKEYFDRRFGGAEGDDEGWDWDDVESELNVGVPSGYVPEEEYASEDDPAVVLLRHLLREWFAGEEDRRNDDPTKHWPWAAGGRGRQVPLMRFPSQIATDGGMSLRELVQREFRAPSVDEMEAEKSKTKKAERDASTSEKVYPPSSYMDDEVRIQTAFYTLAELNRKLAWASDIGFPASSQHTTKQERDWKRLVQAAKGVSLLPVETGASFEEALSEQLLKEPSATGGAGKGEASESDGKSDGDATTLSEQLLKEQLATSDADEGEASERVGDARTSSVNGEQNIPSHRLQRGTYLVAHPLMTGYFAKSVIVILDHTEENDGGKMTEGESGGTYGLIINRLALQQPEAMSQLEMLRRQWEEKQKQSQQEKDELLVGGESESAFESSGAQGDAAEEPASDAPTRSSSAKTSSGSIPRPFSLTQAINAYDFPETVQDAFGDLPVRAGGPVNLSLQMIHRRTLEAKKEDDTDGCDEAKSSSSDVGGTILAGEDDERKDSEEAIYFGGDVIKASHAVLEGKSDQDDFSFVIGASCWAPGQLANEIERGCWLPFRGPPQMAMTGMVDHNEVVVPATEDGHGAETGTKLSPFPPRMSNTAISSVAGPVVAAKATTNLSTAPRPVGDLWLSVMCALGENEADLAYMMLDNQNVNHSFGDACDNVDR